MKMKMQKVIRLAKQLKWVTFYQEYDDEKGYRGPQWLNVGGAAAFNLDGMPRITSKEEFQKAFDIRADKCDVDFSDLPNTLDFSRYQKGEMQAEPMKVTIGTNDDVLRIFQFYNGNVRGSIMVRTALLEPFAGNEEIMYTVRKSANGKQYLCVMDGMLLAAIILPYQPTYERKQAIKHDIELVVKELERSLAWDRVNAGQK